MNNIQQTILFLYAIFGLFGVFVGYRKCVKEKNNLGLVGIYVIYGAFVWADLVVFGIFWFLFTLICIFLRDWLLFLLGQSIFWLIRSHGETIYWFNQQFSPVIRNSLKERFFAKYFGHDEYTLWFVMQIAFQCVATVAAILSLYFGKLWLDARF